ERALKLNPANEQTRTLISKLLTDAPSNGNGMTAVSPTPLPEKTDTSSWNSLRISTNEMNVVSGSGLKPQVTAEMEDMGLTPDLGAVLTATSEMKPTPPPETRNVAATN